MALTEKTIRERLQTYPGAHPGEKWKLEKDLNKCTAKEKEKIKKYGSSIEELMKLGLNRGEVSHVLTGYLHTNAR